MQPYLRYNVPQPPDEPGRKWLPLWTTSMTVSGIRRYVQGWVSVRRVKAPRRRFDPGQHLRYQGQLYQVVYVYRTESDPSEWTYYLEERSGLILSTPGSVQQILEGEHGVGGDTLRVVQEVFPNDAHARAYFADIYCGADALVICNKKLTAGAQVVSSGSLLEAP